MITQKEQTNESYRALKSQNDKRQSAGKHGTENSGVALILIEDPPTNRKLLYN
jgi:hypothetical protein